MVLVVLTNTSRHFFKTSQLNRIKDTERKKNKQQKQNIVKETHTHKYNPSIRFLYGWSCRGQNPMSKVYSF